MPQLAVLPLQRLDRVAGARAGEPALVALGLTGQFDSVCAVQPILAAIEAIAAHRGECSARCSNTSRNARLRTSAENLGEGL